MTPRPTAEDPSWADLELPKMEVASLVRMFGPGMILMMTGVGTSHLVTAPTAGGRFGYALLWCIPVAYISKYYGFEMAFRFTHATGKSLIEAYATAWKKWPLWYVLITTLLQSAIGQAGRLIAASAVLYYLVFSLFGLDIPIAAYGLLLGSIAVCGHSERQAIRPSKAQRRFSPGFYLSRRWWSISSGRRRYLPSRIFFQIEIPKDSWLIITAFLGLLPTGVDVSLQASEWGKAKKVGMGRIRGRLEQAGFRECLRPLCAGQETPIGSHHRVAGARSRVLRAVVQKSGCGTSASATSSHLFWPACSCCWRPCGCIPAPWRGAR